MRLVDLPGGPGYEIRCGDALRASTGDPSPQQALLAAVLPEADNRRGIELLIRGIGTGAALRAALKAPRVRQVTVVEPEAALVRWNRRYFRNESLMEDSRAQVVVGDFHEFVHGIPKSYDAIALDYTTALGEGERELTPSTADLLQTRLRPRAVLAVLAREGLRSYGQVLQQTFGEVDKRALSTQDATGRQSERLLYTILQRVVAQPSRRQDPPASRVRHRPGKRGSGSATDGNM